MGDKCKSETQKPPTNPLLSGAGHGFPFDTFQGSSFLVPVSQDNPSVLSDQVGEPDKFVGQDVPSGEIAERLNDPLNIAVESRNDQPPVVQPSNSGYVRLFNAFFGGGKSEQETHQEKENDQAITGSVSSTPRSFSPYVHVPSFQTVTPALQVPSSTSTSTTTLPLDSNSTNSSTFTEVGLAKNHDVSHSEPPSTSADRPPPLQSGFNSNFQNPPYPFQNPGGNFTSPVMFSQNQPSSDLNPVQSHMSKAFPPPVQQNDGYSPVPGADLSKPPLYNPNAPPLFKGDSSKTYRLCHNKRPVYAPIPGLTLSTSVSAPFLQTSDVPVTASSHVYPGPSPANSKPSAYSLPTVVSPQSAVYPSAAHPPTNINSDSFSAKQTPSSQPNILSYFSTSSTGDSFQPTTSQPKIEPVSSVNVQPTPPACAPSQFTPSSVQIFQQPQQQQKQQQQPPPPPPPQQQQQQQPTPPPPQQQQQQQPPPPPPQQQQQQQQQQQPLPPPQQQQQQPATQPPYPTIPSDEDKNLFAPISSENPNLTDSRPPVTVFNPVAVHPSGSLPENLQPQTANEQPASAKIVPPSLNQLAHVGLTGIGYRPPYHHWFFKKDSDSKEYWYPFSMTDSVLLEQTYQSGKLDENTTIATDGGRYDVSILKRLRMAVYWKETPKEVRRCSWFFKNQNDSRYKPYDENTAYQLEEEYKKCVTTDTWRKRMDLNNGEYIVFYSPANIAHFDSYYAMPDGWEAEFADGTQPLPSPVRMVKRGISDDFDIDDGEAPRVDHLVFVVHGIGSACDLKFRTIEEAVDVFRSISHKLIKDHFSNSIKKGLVNRIEILPISWHGYLHGETTGLDRKLESITLKSIPRLRNFTNDTLLDILFYTSPVYCEKIVQQVGYEMKTIYDKFKRRNPNFSGGVSLVGHSLGSLILFDMLCHQKPQKPSPEPTLEPNKAESVLTRRMSGFVIGNADAQQPFIDYPQLPFQPIALFALGSPIGMFITVRGIDFLGRDFKLPTCPRFYNIFHPFDPVAYRVEALLNSELSKFRPVLIPHHKGRKRMHLELKETISRVGADLKQRLVDSIRSTWNTVFQLTALARADDELEQEVDKVIERQIAGSESAAVGLQEQECLRCDIGQLNMGKRVDYVLQEAPLESFNEYVSAIRSHLIYWDSEDTVLMVLREIYGAEGITLDTEVSAAHESVAATSPSTSAPDVGWNVNEEPKQKPTSGGQPPSYGFINN